MSPKNLTFSSHPSSALGLAFPPAAAGRRERNCTPFSAVCSLRSDGVDRLVPAGILSCAVYNDLKMTLSVTKTKDYEESLDILHAMEVL